MSKSIFPAGFLFLALFLSQSVCAHAEDEISGALEQSQAESDLFAGHPPREEMDPKMLWQILDKNVRCRQGEVQYPRAVDASSPRGRLLAELDKVYEGHAKFGAIYMLTGVERTGAEAHAEAKIQRAIDEAKDNISRLTKVARVPARGAFQTVHEYRHYLLKGNILEKGIDYTVACKKYDKSF